MRRLGGAGILAVMAAVLGLGTAPAHAGLKVATLVTEDAQHLPFPWLAHLDASRVKAPQHVTASVSADRHTLTILDPGVMIVAPQRNEPVLGVRCKGGDGRASCTSVDGFDHLLAELGPGDDRFTVPASTGWFVADVTGAEGNDQLSPSPFGGTLSGGPGSDVLVSTYGGQDRDPRTTQYRPTLLNGDDGDDVLRSTADYSAYRAQLSMWGGAGADLIDNASAPTAALLSGSAGDDRIRGGAGADELYGHTGNDVLDAGGGNDQLGGGEGTDELLGGAGVDTAAYDDRPEWLSIAVSLDGVRNDGVPGENDLLTGIENVHAQHDNLDAQPGPPGGDELVGDDGPNLLISSNGPAVIRALGGDDTIEFDGSSALIDGGPGDDWILTQEYYYAASQTEEVRGTRGGAVTVRAGDGDDFIDAGYEAPENWTPDRDVWPDDIACGAGHDRVQADHEDTVAADCEEVAYLLDG